MSGSSTSPTGSLIVYEDDDLLVVEKPAGMNTHAPAPFAGEGIYEWLRHREQRWARLAIIQRLDKETSGVMVFGKTPAANRSLTDQFARHTVRKKYLLATDRVIQEESLVAVSALVRNGDKYLSRPLHAGADRAETRFRIIQQQHGQTLVEAEPVTGRTHQIRVHAAQHGFPILGDTLYGGSPGARLCLHAQELILRHPSTGELRTFRSLSSFASDPRQDLRQAVIGPSETNAFRIVHGASDGWPGWYVERLGEFVLSQSEGEPNDAQRKYLNTLPGVSGVYHKRLHRRIGRASPADVCPQLLSGQAAPDRFTILENGVRFELSFGEGYSLGLFPDQRDNRRRFLTGHIAADFAMFGEGMAGREVLNTFAYTCGFSVCAARAGARTVSLDLSKKYLDWGKKNFSHNQLDSAGHEFIFGDTFDWLRRWAKKKRTFDAIVLDPPTFSNSKEHGVFRAEKDYGRLVDAALPVLKPGGILFASTNVAGLSPEVFLETIISSIAPAGRRVAQQHYVPQPPDFPITRAEPAYLKTVWLRLL